MTTTTQWDLQEKPGVFEGGWNYNDANLTYNEVMDPDGGGSVYYNGVGESQVWTLVNKI